MAKIDYTKRISATDTTLVLVDHLTGFDNGLRSIERERYRKNVRALAEIGRIFKLPTFILGDEGEWRGSFYPEVIQAHPDAPRFARSTPSAWKSQDFRSAVKATRNSTIVFGGISIDNCTMMTALDALHDGYRVHVVVDASGTESVQVELAAMMRLSQAGAVMTNWVSLGSELLTDWGSPQGPGLGDLYRDYSAWGPADAAPAP